MPKDSGVPQLVTSPRAPPEENTPFQPYPKKTRGSPMGGATSYGGKGPVTTIPCLSAGRLVDSCLTDPGMRPMAMGQNARSPLLPRKKKKYVFHVCMYFMYVCMYVCMHACMHVCIYFSIYLFVYLYVCLSNCFVYLLCFLWGASVFEAPGFFPVWNLAPNSPSCPFSSTRNWRC